MTPYFDNTDEMRSGIIAEDILGDEQNPECVFVEYFQWINLEGKRKQIGREHVRGWTKEAFCPIMSIEIQERPSFWPHRCFKPEHGMLHLQFSMSYPANQPWMRLMSSFTRQQKYIKPPLS